MWLLFLRFNNQGSIRTYHVRCHLRRDAYAVLELANKRGLTPDSKLENYFLFRSGLTIHPYQHLNYTNDFFLLAEDFVRLWKKAEPQKNPEVKT